jgi:hypothetical protein
MADGLLVYHDPTRHRGPPGFFSRTGGKRFYKGNRNQTIIVCQTTYIRETRHVNHLKKDENCTASEKQCVEDVSHTEAPCLTTSTRINYFEQLRVWNGVFTEVSLFKLFLRPLPFLLSPVVSIITLAGLLLFIWFKLHPVLVHILGVWNANRVAKYVYSCISIA